MSDYMTHYTYLTKAFFTFKFHMFPLYTFKCNFIHADFH